MTPCFALNVAHVKAVVPPVFRGRRLAQPNMGGAREAGGPQGRTKASAAGRPG